MTTGTLTIRDRDIPKLKERAEAYRAEYDTCNMEPVLQPAEPVQVAQPSQHNNYDKSRWRNSGKGAGRDSNPNSNQRQQSWTGDHANNPSNQGYRDPYPSSQLANKANQEPRETKNSAPRNSGQQGGHAHQQTDQTKSHEHRRSRSRSASVDMLKLNDGNDHRNLKGASEMDLTIPRQPRPRPNETSDPRTNDGKKYPESKPRYGHS